MEAMGTEPDPAREAGVSEPSATDAPVPSEDGAEPPTSLPPDGEGPRAPPSRRRLWIALAIVAVVVLVVLGLSFTGLLGSQYDLLAPKSPTSSESVPFSQAYDAANSSVQAQGGSWGLISVDGFDVPGGAQNPFSHTNTSSPCTVGTFPSLVNSASADVTKGLSPYWLFSFESTTNLSLFEVGVVNGQAQVLGTTPPSTPCAGAGRAGFLAPAGSIEDSSAAVASLRNLTGFLQSFPNASFAFFLSDLGGEIGKVSGTANWLIEGSPCLALTTAVSAAGDPVYVGETNGTTDHVYGDESLPGFGACETPGTLGPALDLERNVRVTASPLGGSTYTDGITAVNGTLTPSAFHPALYLTAFGKTSPSESAPSTLNFSVLDGAGAPVANYNFTTASWTVGATVALVAGDSLEVNTTGSLEGAALVLVANAPATGQIGIFLP